MQCEQLKSCPAEWKFIWLCLCLWLCLYISGVLSFTRKCFAFKDSLRKDSSFIKMWPLVLTSKYIGYFLFCDALLSFWAHYEVWSVLGFIMESLRQAPVSLFLLLLLSFFSLYSTEHSPKRHYFSDIKKLLRIIYSVKKISSATKNPSIDQPQPNIWPWCS